MMGYNPEKTRLLAIDENLVREQEIQGIKHKL